MNITLNEQWHKRMVELEGDLEVGAGGVALDPVFQMTEPVMTSLDEGRLALGHFVKLMRRKRQLSIEMLASEINVELVELMRVETVLTELPSARTLYNIAEYFNVSYEKLMGLSGLMQLKERNYLDISIRFAARSEMPVELSPAEQELTEQWLTVLSEKHE